MQEHIVAVFESERPATEAAQELERAGIPSSAIRQFGSGSQKSAGGTSSGGGFWAWLLGEESGGSASAREPHPDEALYDRHVEAGRTVLSVTVADDSKIHDAIMILDAHHPIDVEESTEDAAESGADTVVPGLEVDGRNSVAASGTDFSTSEVIRPADTAGSAGTGGSSRVRRFGAGSNG